MSGGVSVLSEGAKGRRDGSAAVPERGDAGRTGRRFRGRWLVPVLLCGLVGIGIVVWATPVLGVRDVQVVGISDGAVAGAVERAAALDRGTPLARVDTDAVAARVLAVDAIAAVSVDRNWPNTIVIDATARVAVATTQANGQWWLVDAVGRPFSPAAVKPSDLMVLQLATPREGDRSTLAALGVLQSLQPALRAKVAQVSASTEYTVTLRLADGRSVLWGSDSDAPAKNAAALAVLAQPGTDFDVSDPTLVTVAGS